MKLSENINKRLIFYDFEVFKFDWLVVLIDYESKIKKVIVNNRRELMRVYYKHKNDIWVGFNSRNYDSSILKAIVLNMDVKEVNDKLIKDGLKPFEISRRFNNLDLINYDTMVDRNSSLKQLEGMMGHMIKESDIPFDIDRKLTKDEIKETIFYCTHDVEETIEVFEQTKSDFDAHLSLIEEFNLPLEYLTKTKAKLSATILGAERVHGLKDEMEYRFPPALLGKYEYVKEHFDKNRFLTYVNEKGINKKNQLTTEIYGLKTVYGYGGFHGALSKYTSDDSDGGLIIHSDVASLYPSIMIEYNLLSRGVKEPKKYSDILEKRLELKRAGKKKEQAPYKIVLNSTYGITIDQYSAMYDPRTGREICIFGQLLMTDLIDKLEKQLGDRCIPIQYNTDGIIMKLLDKNDYNEYLEICDKWSKRTRLNLEHDLIKKIYQKDVNNYVFEFTNGKLECKGAYLQLNNCFKNDMSILNDAVRNYLLHETPVEKTINECDELIKFQHINKIGKTYCGVKWGDEDLSERVIRTFASTNEEDPGLFKVKIKRNKDGDLVKAKDKVANNSEHVFIDNENIINKKCPEYLDKQWYIDEAIKRLESFGIKYKAQVDN